MEPLMAEPSLMSAYSWNCSMEEDLEQVLLERRKVIGFVQSRDYFLVLHYCATRYTIGLNKNTPVFSSDQKLKAFCLPWGDKNLLARVFSSVDMYFHIE